MTSTNQEAKQNDVEAAKEPQPKLDKAKEFVKDNVMLWAKVVIFKVGFYVFDIVTDIVNGADYLHGNSLPLEIRNETEVCQDLKSYSHPVWGSLTICLTWLPGIIYLIGQGSFKYTQGKLTWKMALGFAGMALVWPLFIFSL